MEVVNKSQHTLSGLLKARFPFIYIPTWEEDRAVTMVQSVVENEDIIKTVRKTYIWTQTDGLVDNKGTQVKSTKDPISCINFIQTIGEDAVFILKDFHVYFGVKNKTADYGVIRKLRDSVLNLKNGQFKKNVIFIAPELLIPNELLKEVYVFEFPMPTVEEMKIKLDEMLEVNTMVSHQLSEEDKEKLAKAALGLTLQEAENAFARAMVEDGQMTLSDIQVVFEEKKQVVRKAGILDFIKSDFALEDIGGLENLKRWLQKRNNTWLDSAKKYNIPAPKGVLITGVPGCGKSLTAKAMSTIWQLPLLKLDMGRIFSGIVGSSEENMRQAIHIAEAVSPSILWIDEIEKGLGSTNGLGDGGTGARIFGTFLTWMQEKTAPVFVVATANNISALPPELLRKGRFDEIFFVDLPTTKERKDIFSVHLKKRLNDDEISKNLLVNGEIPDRLLEELSEMTEGFVGAEIEQIVISALYEAFFENRELKQEDLKNVISNMVPLSVTQKEQIRSLREWANVRAVAATAKDDLVKYAIEKTDDTDDISQTRGGRTIDF